jgi:cytochrome c5
MSVSLKPLSILFAFGLAACASGGGTPEVTPASTPAAGAAAAPVETETAVADGVFTATQADGGRDSFRAQCTECHFSGEFSDDQFKFKWSRRTANDLYDFILTQMPESAPGSLTAEESVNLTAYILRLNGLEEGTMPLPTDEAALSAISLRPIRN